MRQPGHEKHEVHAQAARDAARFAQTRSDLALRATETARAQVHATLAVYEALLMLRGGTGPTVGELARDD